jgi:hypothetical protein
VIIVIGVMGNNGKKGDEGADGSAAVVQRVVHEVSDRISYPILTKTNYSDWTLLMKLKLKARALQGATEKGRVVM